MKTNSIKKANKINFVKGTRLIRVQDIGKNFKFHKGNIIEEILVKDGMEGNYFGEYFLTKRLGKIIHQKKRNKKKK